MSRLFIRTIYLYLFSLLGLVILVIGLIKLVDLGLKIYVFTKADQEIYMYKSMPPVPIRNDGLKYDDVKEIAEMCKNNSAISSEYKQFLNSWLSDYKSWKKSMTVAEEQRVAKRQREAASALAFIIIGLPLYLYHWKIIKKENI